MRIAMMPFESARPTSGTLLLHIVMERALYGPSSGEAMAMLGVPSERAIVTLT